MTDKTILQTQVSAMLSNIEARFNEPMSKHTSFRIGGPAEVMLFPKTPEELSQILIKSDLLDGKIAILGAGTNILAPDEGVNGIVVCLKDTLDGLELLDGGRIRVCAGVTMSRAAVFAANHGLGGLEFAHGIPGTVGGGVYMNAGAYGGEICQVCESVTVMRANGEITEISGEQMDFRYRHSCLEGTGDIVLSAVFALEPKPGEEIRNKMQDLMQRRKTSQPLDLPSAGSAFKRPVGGYAAALIQDAGLKGFRIGDAAVSEKHSGFVVNLGEASAADVKKLLSVVSEKVYDMTGILLEPEIRIW